MSIKLIGDSSGNIAEVTSSKELKVSQASPPTGASLDGTDATGITQLTGGVGIRGWLSGIYSKLSGTLGISGTVAVSNLPATQPISGSVSVSNLPATQPVSAASLPLPTGAATDGTDSTGVVQLAGGAGIRGWLSGIFSKLSGILSVACAPISNTGTITSTQNVAISLVGQSGVGFDVTGTWGGTLIPEALVGNTWALVDVFADIASGENVTNSITANGSYSFILPSGATQVRLRGLTVTSGTATVNLAATQSAFNYPFFARGAGDTGPASYGACTGGVDDTNTFRLNPANRNGERIAVGRSQFANLTTNGTATHKSGWGRLRGFAFGSLGTAGTLTVYDNTAGSGTKIMTINLAAAGALAGLSNLDLEFTTGLTIVRAGFTGAPDVTVLWN